MPTRPGRDVLMEALEAEGVQYIFGNPGTTEGAIMHALEDHPDLEYILVAQEGVAVGMADGYARESGRPGFVNLHIETGLSNGLSLMCNAYAGGTPMVVTAANSSIGKVAEGRTDLVDLARPFSKWGAEVTNADQIPAVMHRAFREAKTPPTGPTFVSFAQNALDEMTDVPVAPSGDLSTVLTPDPSAIQAAAELLASAERPALLVGDRVAQYGAVDQMVRVAELLGTPVYGASYPAMMFPTSHPQWMHQLPPYVGLYREAFAETDVLLAVGARVFHDFFAPATGILADDASLVHLDINQDAIGRVEPTDVGIWTDLGIGLDELYAAVSELQSPAQADAARSRAASVAAGYPGRRASPPESDDARPMPSTAMMAALAEGLPADVIVVDDSISCRPDLHAAVTFDHQRRVQAERAGGAIGWGMGGALGVALAAPDQRVVAVIGDGSAMLTVQALWTAAAYRIPVVFCICNNAGYRVLKLNLRRWFADVLHEPDRPSQYLGMDLNQPFDLAAIAQAMNVPSERIEDPTRIAPALTQALSRDGPTLLDIIIDGSV
ncbi:MAG: thiamine pyrophosphate-binding protein [Chloroflexota bacterium]|nr:thiamine pyrophosphate-binding protein [Chloroflexota bacterium]MDE2920517.1 thiamine pyrophosphate-binding protein [Chloroflexota bacterium]